jgi:Effector protein
MSFAQAKIEVRGEEQFKDKASRALDDIKRTTPDGRALVRLLETSKHIHVIRRTTANVDSNAPQSLTNATNGVGTGSTTRWNANLILPYADGVNRDPTAALFHELCHAFEADRGVWDGSLEPATGIRYSEIQAIRTENAYRRAKGLPERKKYGRQDLPPKEAEDVAQASLSVNPPDGLGCEEHGNPCICNLCGSRMRPNAYPGCGQR